MKSFGAAFAGCLVIAVAVLGVSFGIGSAQGGLQERAARVIDLELNELEIGKAVAYLFAKVNGRYVLAPDVKGITTVSLRQVPFEGALANVLKQVNATWRVRDGVYEIVSKPLAEEIDWARHEMELNQQYGEEIRTVLARLMPSKMSYSISPQLKGRIKLDEKDLRGLTFEAALQRVLSQVGGTCRVVDGIYEFLPSQRQDAGQKLVNISFQGEDVRDAIRKLFRSVDIPYSVAVEIRGTVTVDFKNVPLNQALATMLSQVNATYQVEGGVYQIVLRQISADPSTYSRDQSRLMLGDTREAVVMTSDEKFLYVLRGTMLYKVNKMDLKTVEMRKLGE